MGVAEALVRAKEEPVEADDTQVAEVGDKDSQTLSTKKKDGTSARAEESKASKKDKPKRPDISKSPEIQRRIPGKRDRFLDSEEEMQPIQRRNVKDASKDKDA